MNAQNAQSLGYSDGKRFIQGFLGSTTYGFSDEHKEIVLSAARNRARYIYRVQSQRTRDLYLQGNSDAWEAYKAEQARKKREAEARAAIPHNPSSRFCSCMACSKGE